MYINFTLFLINFNDRNMLFLFRYIVCMLICTILSNKYNNNNNNNKIIIIIIIKLLLLLLLLVLLLVYRSLNIVLYENLYTHFSVQKHDRYIYFVSASES